MGKILDFLGFGERPLRSDKSNSVLTMGELVDQYDIVSVHAQTLLDSQGKEYSPFIVVAEREHGPVNRWPGNGMVASANPGGIRLAAQNVEGPVPVGELGSSSPSPFTSASRSEYNKDWQGLSGLQKADQMRRSDGTVRGTLRLLKTPVLGARWFVEPVSDKKADVAVADFIWHNLTCAMTISWTQVLTEALLMEDFGYYMFEKVFDTKLVDGKYRTMWTKLAPRHPMDVKKWQFDAHGGPAGVDMYGKEANVLDIPKPDPHPTTPQRLYTPNMEQTVWIPIEKLLVFTFDREASNIEGMSVLRSAYKHWYYKEQLYKIDAIQKERHGIGIPVIKLPVNFTAGDKAAADDLGRNLRTNERAHVTLPPGWELMFAKLEGNPVNAMESINHHDARIRENILATFMGEGKQTKEEDQTLFLKSLRFTADIVCDAFNIYAIPQLVDYNLFRGASKYEYPKLRARRIGETEDQRTMSFTLRNLVGAKIIVPDRPLEEWARRELDAPPIDDKTRAQYQERVDAGNKQAGPDNPGLPRQTAQQKAQLPAKNAGTDQSGDSGQK